MDDVYEGWAGLEAGIVELGEEVLARRVVGEASRIRVYDWNTESMSPGPQIPANVDLVVEGCGSLGALHAESAGVRLWIDAPADLRRVRAFSREGEDFERHWDMWEDQFTGYVERVRPQNIASLVIRANR
jgi:uridine kinase